MASVIAEPNLTIRSVSQGGTRPPCNGRSAVPERFISIILRLLRRLFTQAAVVLPEHGALYVSGGYLFLFAFSGSVVYDFHPPPKLSSPTGQ